MRTIAIERIIVPEDRQRKAFAKVKLDELEESILRRGLLHPLTVQPAPNGQYILRAGERRLRCITHIAEGGMSFFCDGEEIKPGFAPILRTNELDPIALKELEFDENKRRENLSWQEECSALNEIMAMKRALDPDVTRMEVAREISNATSEPVATVRENLAHAELVAKHLDNPQVASARNMREAYTIVSRNLQAEFEAALNAQAKPTTDHEIYNDDLLRFLPTLQEARYDVLLADPPYGMGADEFGTAGPSHEYSDTAERGLEIASAILREGFRLCKPEAHCYVFCDIDLFHRLQLIATKVGWTVFRTPLVWDKGGAQGHNPIPAQAIRRSYELILYAYKGDKPALRMITDVIRDIPNTRDTTHAAEKPAALYQHLLSRSATAGGRVLDPCCGSGPVFEAANNLGLRVLGIELNKSFFTIASNRRFKKGSLDGKPASAAEPEASAADL